jgi:uncharacterized phage protein gp47/JayE
MADYLPFTPIPLDSATLKMRAYQRMADRVPGWLPSPAEPETWIIDDYAENLVEVAVIAQQIPAAIVRWGGAAIFGIIPQDPTEARADTTWTMRDTAGYTIPAGTVVTVAAAGDDIVPFATSRDVTVPPGSAATAAGAVEIVATEPGERGSGLTAAPQTALDFVQSIAIVGQTTGGTDGETDEQYLDRVARERQLPGTPVRAEHLELLARSVPGVVRAFGIDGYIPGPPAATGQENPAAVAAVDAAGEDVPSGLKATILALLQARREVNFLFSVISPTYTTVDVTFTAVAESGWVVSDVQARAVTALQDYLSPAVWPWGGTVRRRELEGVLNVVDGLDYVSSLTLGVSGQAQSTNDLAIAGAAPLTRPGTITPTVTAP